MDYCKIVNKSIQATGRSAAALTRQDFWPAPDQNVSVLFERLMKTKWKIIIGVVVALFAVLVFMFSLMHLNVEMVEPESAPPDLEMHLNVEMVEPESALPDPEPPSNLDKLLDEMEFGVIAFNAPTHINIEDSSQIQLLLSLADTVEKLKQSITKEGEKVGATIRVTDRMEARLSGYMFQITAITHETQAVSKSQETEWKWEIHPKEEGKHRLHLTLTALLEIDGHSTPRAIRTFDKKIEVTVTTTQKIRIFFKNNWQWLWAAILVPVVGWLWKRKKTANKAN